MRLDSLVGAVFVALLCFTLYHNRCNFYYSITRHFISKFLGEPGLAGCCLESQSPVIHLLIGWGEGRVCALVSGGR